MKSEGFPSLSTYAFKCAPGVALMKGNRSHRNWGEKVLALSEREELAPFRGVLREVVDDQLQSLEPLRRFRESAGTAVPYAHYATAATIGLGELKSSPEASFVVTWIALLGWAGALGKDLYNQRDGMPHFGWTSLPHAYATASLKLGDSFGALGLAELSYDVLLAGKYLDDPRLEAALNKYRALAANSQRRMELALGNLVEDLHRSAGPGLPNFRPEIRALLWTQGFVPECQSMSRSEYVPSRSFLKRLVWLSIQRVPIDPLTQFVWLELKDRPPFSLRSHAQLFHRINRRYSQYLPDDVARVPPSRRYAQTLIAWLAGRLTAAQAQEYLGGIAEVRRYEEARSLAAKADWSVFLRMIALANCLAREFDLFAADVSRAEQDEMWSSLWSQATRMRERGHLNPHRPDLSGTLNYPMFQVVERELAAVDADQSTARGDALVTRLELHRAAALSFALATNPPAPPQSEPELTDLFAQERELITKLRGAFFNVNLEFLPEHFGRYSHELASGRSNPSQILGFEAGRRQYKQVEQGMTELFAKMMPLAPQYAYRRTNPAADTAQLLQALAAHAGP